MSSLLSDRSLLKIQSNPLPMVSLETLPLSCPRLDLAIASSPRSSLWIRRQDLRLGLGLGFAPRFSSLRLSRHFLKLPAVMDPKVYGRRIAVACEAQGTATEVPDVTKDAWQSLVIENTKPVIVEFWAPWCGPCRVIHPVIAKLAKSYEGKLECFKINTDDFPDLASQYGIRSIPTIMIFKNGEKKDVVIGSVPESTLVSCISKYLGR